MSKKNLIRKAISMLLVSGMLAGSFAACTAKMEPDVKINENVSAASSDTGKYVTWLDDRLGYISENVILGIGNSDSYGVDMSNFEDDGYIIRKQGESTVIFGKTEDGLDRAVRKYANLLDDGESTENVVYHEGYRVERFTLLGADISEYTVVYAEDANENVKFAVSELTRLVEKACGAKLDTVQGESVADRQIIFRVTDDEELRNDGYRYFDEDGNLVIEGAVKRGCMNGVYRFLENECGWDHLTYGDSYLNETEHLDIPAGLYGTETPAFEFLDESSDEYKYAFVNEKNTPTLEQLSYGTIDKACHGIANNNWLGKNDFNMSGASQPCFTSEENLEIACNNISEWIEKEEAAGRLWGREIQAIDIAQGDTPLYCICDNCCDLYKIDGSYVGPVVDFANKLAEMLEPSYPGMKLLIFGYFETVKPPKVTRPSDAVYITYAPNGNCAKHPMGEGEKCTTETFNGWNNAEFGGFLEEWCSMSDNVYVWYYCWGVYPKSYTMLDVFYKDMKWFAELGVKGIYINRMDFTHDALFLIDYMYRDLNWDVDKTEEEFNEYLDELFEHVYGDGWEAVREVERIQYEAQLRSVGCNNIWHYASIVPMKELYDHEYYADHFEEILTLMDTAIKRAGNERQLHYCRMYSIGLIYMGCVGSYFAAYDAYDTEKLEWLQEKYSLIFEYIEAENFDPEDTMETGHPRLPESLEELMWTHMRGERNRFTGYGTVQRPVPEWAL